MNKLIKLFFFLLLIFIGILIGRVVKDWPLFIIDYKLSISHIASISTTLFIAILISYYFENEKHYNRKEKELIIKRVDDIYILIENISANIEDGTISYQQAASKVKRINLAYINIFEILKSSKLKVQSNFKNDFSTKNRELKNLLTKTPVISEEQLDIVDLPIEVKNGIINYNESRIAEIDTLFEKIKSQTVKLQLEINKC